MMLKLKLQYFGHLMRRVDSLEKTLMLGGFVGRKRRDHRGWDGWMASLTRWTWVWVNSGSWWWTGRSGMLWFMGSQRAGHDWATELNWTELIHDMLFKGNFNYIVICKVMLLLLSHPVMSDPLWPHGLQHTSPSCPSPSPGVCPSSCSLRWWCHPAISSSDTLFFCSQSSSYILLYIK